MRHNILILWLYMLISGYMTSAQTKIIAHESHGGNASAFSLEKEDNFGLPRNFDYQLDSVIRYKKNAVIEVYHMGKCISCRLVDTTKQHPIFNDPQVSLDSMQKLFPEVVFVGFGKTKKTNFKASFNPSFASVDNIQKHQGTQQLIKLVMLLFVLLSILLWKQAKVGKNN